jgi:hypothetical protein
MRSIICGTQAEGNMPPTCLRSTQAKTIKKRRPTNKSTEIQIVTESAQVPDLFVDDILPLFVPPPLPMKPTETDEQAADRIFDEIFGNVGTTGKTGTTCTITYTKTMDMDSSWCDDELKSILGII